MRLDRIGRLVVCLGALVSVARAEVFVEVAPDGRMVMRNNAARTAVSRRPVEGLKTPAEELRQVIEESARSNDLEPDLIRAVIQVESAYDPSALSRKGAMGLMQLMPETARDLAVSDPWDPEQNVRGGSRYLRRMLDEFGEVELALAGYNAGPEAVKRFQGIPPYPETLGYVEKVLRLYRGEEGFTLSRSPFLRGGRKTYVSRDDSGRLVMTTTRPGR